MGENQMERGRKGISPKNFQKTTRGGWRRKGRRKKRGKEGEEREKKQMERQEKEK